MLKTQDILELIEDKFPDFFISSGAIESVNQDMIVEIAVSPIVKNTEFDKYFEYLCVLSSDDKFLEELNDNTFNFVDIKSKSLNAKRFFLSDQKCVLTIKNLPDINAYIIPIFNIREYFIDNNIDQSMFGFEYVTNNEIIGDIILKNDTLLSESRIFYDEQSNVYSGSVQLINSNFYDTNGKLLTVSNVPNHKFVDYRQFNKKIEETVFSPSLNSFDIVSKTTRNKSQYITNAGSTKTYSGTNNHTFIFDYKTCFKDNCVVKNIDFNKISYTLNVFRKTNISNENLDLKLPETEYGVEYASHDDYELINSFQTTDVSGVQDFTNDANIISFKNKQNHVIIFSDNLKEDTYNYSYRVSIEFVDPSQKIIAESIAALESSLNDLNIIYSKNQGNYDGNQYQKIDESQENMVISLIDNVMQQFSLLYNLDLFTKEYIRINLFNSMSLIFGNPNAFDKALTYIKQQIVSLNLFISSMSNINASLTITKQLDDLVQLQSIKYFSIIDKTLLDYKELVEINTKIISDYNNGSQEDNLDYSLINGITKYTESESVTPQTLNSYTVTTVKTFNEYKNSMNSFDTIKYLQMFFEIYFDKNAPIYYDQNTLKQLRDFVESCLDVKKESLFNNNKVIDLNKIVNIPSFNQSLNQDIESYKYKQEINDYISLAYTLTCGHLLSKYKKADMFDFLSVDADNSIFKKQEVSLEYVKELPYHLKKLMFSNIFFDIYSFLFLYFNYKNIYIVERLVGTRWVKLDLASLKDGDVVACRFVRYSDDILNQYLPLMQELDCEIYNKVFVLTKKTTTALFIDNVIKTNVVNIDQNYKKQTNLFVNKTKIGNKQNDFKKDNFGLN
jgi:hypothetical protein